MGIQVKGRKGISFCLRFGDSDDRLVAISHLRLILRFRKTRPRRIDFNYIGVHQEVGGRQEKKKEIPETAR